MDQESPTTPQADADCRELTAEERAEFVSLGYSPDCKAWMSKSTTNPGRWFVGEKRSKFGCWLDTPVKEGLVITHDGRTVSKEELSQTQPYYRPWRDDQNTNYHSFIHKRLDRAVGVITEQAKFIINLQERLLAVEDFLEKSTAQKEEDGGEMDHY